MRRVYMVKSAAGAKKEVQQSVGLDLPLQLILNLLYFSLLIIFFTHLYYIQCTYYTN